MKASRRCKNCYEYPIEILSKSDLTLICPNCGVVIEESIEENFVRNIYENYME